MKRVLLEFEEDADAVCFVEDMKRRRNSLGIPHSIQNEELLGCSVACAKTVRLLRDTEVINENT